MKAFANTDIGLTRQINEDDYCVIQNERKDWLAIVCDGIGGSAAGEVASHIAVSTLRDAFLEAQEFTKDSQVNQWIQENLNKANDAIFSKSLDDSAYRGMGTTCVGCLIANHSTYIFNVGDSRLYAYYKDGLIQMSEDHSVIAQLIREGKISAEEAKSHSQRNTLTNALGIWHVFRIDINKIDSGYEYLLLCSDGLHSYVDYNEIKKTIDCSGYSLKDKVNTLIEKANQVGGYDNCTVVLLQSEEDVDD